MKGIFIDRSVYAADTTQIKILQVVADKPSCHISHVVHRLLPDYSESRVRSGVHKLIAGRCLDPGKSSQEILLRLTSAGRIALQQESITSLIP